MRRVTLLVVALLLASAGAARAKPSLIVGVTEDGLKSEPEAALQDARKLGIGAFRITLRWRPGLAEPTPAQVAELERATSAPSDVSIVVSVFGERAVHAPTTESRRDEFCGFVEAVVRRHDRIRHVAIWNEPNKTFFWSPQFNGDGTSASPGAYGALLARCWDVLHEVQSDIMLIAPSTSPRGNDNPNAVSNVSHSPTQFVRELGRQYRESGRSSPIFDVVGHHVHGVHSAERPWRAHPGSGITQGDLGKLERAFAEAFAGTAQPVPGRCVEGKCVPVWWLEAGFQTKPDRNKESLYTGLEVTPRPLPDSSGELELDPLPDSKSLAPDQATQLVSAVRLAYCQPHVEAFFNFLLWDEQRLEGWQSAPLWVDRTPKGSYAAFRDVIREVTEGEIQCSGLRRAAAREEAKADETDGGGLATRPRQTPPQPPADSDDPDDPAGSASPARDRDPDGLSPWLLAIPGAVVLLLGGAVEYARRRRRQRLA
jgi:hypothetical protein